MRVLAQRKHVRLQHGMIAGACTMRNSAYVPNAINLKKESCHNENLSRRATITLISFSHLSVTLYINMI